MERNIYVMLSVTKTKTARIIRLATRAEYNHVSVCFDEKLDYFVSFGRYCHCMPFIGGLVHETADRFTLRKNRNVRIKVFKIPVSEFRHAAALKRVAEIAADDEYAYNLLSALTFPVFHGREHYKTFTCSEFVSHILRIARPDLSLNKPDCKVVPDDYSLLLDRYLIYEGQLKAFERFASKGNGEYFKKVSFFKRQYRTASYIKHRYWRYKSDQD